MIHTAAHDPVLMHRLCWPCHQAMSVAAAKVVDMNLPLNRLVRAMRGEAKAALELILPTMARGPAS